MVRDLRLKRLPQSFKYAFGGIAHVLRTERNMQIHIVAAIIAIGLAIYLDLPTTEFAIIILAVALVLAAEIFNTVIEDFLDIIHPTHHEAVRRIKDALAGAVLLAAMAALAIGLLIFGPLLLARAGL
jgi:diacylglycerol kinase